MSMPSTALSLSLTAGPANSSTPVGALVGGVVGGKFLSCPGAIRQSSICLDGGLAVVGIIIGGIVYSVLHRRRESAARLAGS